MISRLFSYHQTFQDKPDIVIDVTKYHSDRYPLSMSPDMVAYLESGYQFYRALIDHNGFLLHSSAVALGGRVYLFSGPSGVGKSTHTQLWRQVFGEDAFLINDDKPALREIEGRWFAYGTPWCGKDGINQNARLPIAGICFLQQGEENSIRRLENGEAITKIMDQTLHRFRDPVRLGLLLGHIGRLLNKIPVYELVNRPCEEAAKLSYSTMLRGAEEAGIQAD